MIVPIRSKTGKRIQSLRFWARVPVGPRLPLWNVPDLKIISISFIIFCSWDMPFLTIYITKENLKLSCKRKILRKAKEVVLHWITISKQQSDLISHVFRNIAHIFPENVLYLQHVCLVIRLQYNCFPAESYSSEVTLGPITANYSLALEYKSSPAKLPPLQLYTMDLGSNLNLHVIVVLRSLVEIWHLGM